MYDFEYVKPSTVVDAVSILSTDEAAKALAGGMTFIPVLKQRFSQPSTVVDLSGLGLSYLRREDDVLVIGAMTPHGVVAASPLVQQAIPALAWLAGHIGDRQVRNRGTIGGNCCLNDPTNNFPPLLSALGARFRILGPVGERVLPAAEFFLGTLATAVRPGELLTAIEIPPLPSNAVVAHEHLQVGADSWALARAVVRLDVTDGVVVDARVFLGAVYGSPLRLPEVERHLVGAAVTPSLADVTGVLRDVDAADDVHCSAAYRREMAEVQLRRALLAAVQRSTR